MYEQYDADYFLHGRETGKSLYENFRWLPELTIPMVKRIIMHLSITESQAILDYGCARGYTVRAFRELGYEAYGVDISEWAIINCDESVKSYLSCTSEVPPGMDWIIAKDVLEHVPQVAGTITKLMEAAKVGIFAVVPLSNVDGGPYIIPDYELDITHIHRLSLATWVRFFIRHGWTVECAYRTRGVKDNYHGWATWVKANYDNWRLGNGFIKATKL